MDPITGFISEFFIQPIINPAVPGYNIVNTLTYGLILLGITFYVIFPQLQKRGYVLDYHFMKMLLPYILFGISLRVLEDQKYLVRSPNPLDVGFYTFTPGIWILTFALVLVGLWLGKFIHKKWNVPSQKVTLTFGLLVALPFLIWNFLLAKEWIGFFAILALSAVISLVIFWIAHRFKYHFMDFPLAKLAFFGQMLDTSATFIALEFFGCGEQHVLPRLLFSALGNWAFFLVKVPLTLIVLYYLDKEFKKEGNHSEAALYAFILIFLSILGLATGGRDTLTVLAGTCTAP